MWGIFILLSGRKPATKVLFLFPPPMLSFRFLFSVCAALVVLAAGSALARPETLHEAARLQLGVVRGYDPAYVSIPYPGGDVAADSGVCTDVLIRAFRVLGLDLQQAIHEDMRAHFSAYPRLWGLRRPDRNIDHRRVPNQEVFFRRRGWALPVTDNPADYAPGDIVTCLIGGSVPHVMIVSDRRGADGLPLIIHNIGSGTQEEEGLFDFTITGHFRTPRGALRVDKRK